MKNVLSTLALATVLVCAACTAAQVTQTATDVQTACAGATAAAGLASAQTSGGANNTVKSVTVYVNSVCGSADTVAAAAANPTTAAWLAGLTTTLQSLAKGS